MAAATDGSWILVVENDDGVREGLLDLLAFHGYRAAAVSSAEEALALVRSEAPPPSLALVDWNLDGASGAVVLRAIRRTPAWQTVRLVVMSASVRLVEGPDTVLPKPFDIPALLAIAAEACAPKDDSASL